MLKVFQILKWIIAYICVFVWSSAVIQTPLSLWQMKDGVLCRVLKTMFAEGKVIKLYCSKKWQHHRTRLLLLQRISPRRYIFPSIIPRQSVPGGSRNILRCSTWNVQCWIKKQRLYKGILWVVYWKIFGYDFS